MLARFPLRVSLTLVGAVALVLAIANPAAAPPGDLDPTFDGDGKVTTDFAESADVVSALGIQGDGKIVAAGVTRVSAGPGDRDFGLARYNPDGSLDGTFDGDGKVTTDFASDSEDVLSAVAIQADGMIGASGCVRCFDATSDFALARYKTDGSLDTTFDGDGRVITDFAGADEATAVAIQGDGRIVAGGHALSPGGPTTSHWPGTAPTAPSIPPSMGTGG